MLVEEINLMKNSSEKSTQQVDRVEKVSHFMDQRLARVEKATVAAQNQLNHDRDSVKKLLLDTQNNAHIQVNARYRPTDSQPRVPKRAMQIKGSGDSIGAKQLLHVAITRIPLDDSIDEQFLKNSIDAKLTNIGAKITHISLLRSAKHTSPPRTKSFKLTIDYPGNPLDVYNASFYPAHIKVARFNFPRIRRSK